MTPPTELTPDTLRALFEKWGSNNPLYGSLDLEDWLNDHAVAWEKREAILQGIIEAGIKNYNEMQAELANLTESVESHFADSGYVDAPSIGDALPSTKRRDWRDEFYLGDPKYGTIRERIEKGLLPDILAERRRTSAPS